MVTIGTRASAKKRENCIIQLKTDRAVCVRFVRGGDEFGALFLSVHRIRRVLLSIKGGRSMYFVLRPLCDLFCDMYVIVNVIHAITIVSNAF